MDKNHDSKAQSNAAKVTADQNPVATPEAAGAGAGEDSNSVPAENNNDVRQIRTPFTDLSQIDADLALARTLQEQERAYMMIRMNGDVSDYGSWGTRSFAADEDFDDESEDESDGSQTSDASDDHEHVHESDDSDEFEFPVLGNEEEEEEDDDDDDGDSEIELNPADFPNDEAYARALQDAEDQELAARLRALSGLSEIVAGYSEELEDHGGDSQDAWEEVDPDNLSYEELLALGDVVGTESRGLSADTIASLPSMTFKMQSNQDGNMESCVICRLDYEEGDTLTVLSCRHSYHPECIDNWLRINKVCPVCSAEVSTSGNS